MRNFGRIPRKLKKRLRDSASPRLFGYKWKRKSILLNAVHVYFEFLFKHKLCICYNFGSFYENRMFEFFGS